MSDLNSLRPPREFHAYCVGAPRSGTHSIAGLFQTRYRTAHEPEVEQFVSMMDAASEGLVDERGIIEFLKERDKRLWLELESSNLLSFFINTLVKEFDGARFIFTIRDCYSWLDSYINHQISRGKPAPHWARLRELYFRPDKFSHSAEEKILAEQELYTLDCYFSFWQRRNNSILATVPQDRLLVIRTYEIGQKAEAMAEFLGVPGETLDPSQSHLDKALNKFGLLLKLDRDFLEEKVDRYCRELMSRYFPEIRSLDDVIKPS